MNVYHWQIKELSDYGTWNYFIKAESLDAAREYVKNTVIEGRPLRNYVSDLIYSSEPHCVREAEADDSTVKVEFNVDCRARIPTFSSSKTHECYEKEAQSLDISPMLFHWHVDYNNRKADYLVTTHSISRAREIILEQINCPGGAAYKEAHHDEYVKEHEPFIAAIDYPIVLF